MTRRQIPNTKEIPKGDGERLSAGVHSAAELQPKDEEAASQPVTSTALNPWSPQDGVLLEALSRGEFAINGFRNRDLRVLLYSRKTTPEQERKRSAAISHRLALLIILGGVRREREGLHLSIGR